MVCFEVSTFSSESLLLSTSIPNDSTLVNLPYRKPITFAKLQISIGYKVKDLS